MSEKVFERRVSVDADYNEQEVGGTFFGDWVTRDEVEETERYDRLRIPLESLVGLKIISSLAGDQGPHGWHAHPRRKPLTARKPQARKINRQYRKFGEKVCQERWRSYAASQCRKLLLEVRPDLKPNWRVVQSDDESYLEIKLEKLIEEELQAEAAQYASTSF